MPVITISEGWAGKMTALRIARSAPAPAHTTNVLTHIWTAFVRAAARARRARVLTSLRFDGAQAAVGTTSRNTLATRRRAQPEGCERWVTCTRSSAALACRCASCSATDASVAPRASLPRCAPRMLGAPRPLYVGTPVNGFFRCAGERGAGVAMILALARHFSRRTLRCRTLCRRRCHTLLFGLTAGHEMADAGLRAAMLPHLAQLADGEKDVPFISVGAE